MVIKRKKVALSRNRTYFVQVVYSLKISENAIRSPQEENQQPFITHSRTKTAKIHIKTKQKRVYDSVNVTAGIVPSNKWMVQFPNRKRYL